jgi:hypothetical protein
MARASKKRVLADLERLSERGKKEVADFAAYLRIKEELEATNEIISDRKLMESIVRGQQDFKTGRFKKWAEVKNNV